MHRDHKMSAADIALTYNLSLSTVKRVISRLEDYSNLSTTFKSIRCKKTKRSVVVLDEIKRFIENTVSRVTARDVQDHLRLKVGVVIPLAQVRSVLRTAFKLSYKRCNKRPIALDMRKLTVEQTLFWVKLSKSIDEFKLLINIDEASINYNTVENYSWSPIGMSSSISNQPFKGAINFIWWITSRGDWFSLWKTSRTNSSHFVNFLEACFTYLSSKYQLEYAKIGVILDNCAVHRSKWVTSFTKKQSINLAFLPAYSPELAPVETVFAKLKRDMVTMAKGKVVRLDKDAGTTLITAAMLRVSCIYVKSLWRRWLRTVDLFVTNAMQA